MQIWQMAENIYNDEESRIPRSTLRMSVCPQNAIVRSSSFRMICRDLVTPSSPIAAGTPEEIANNPQVISAYLGSDDDTDSDDAKHESEEA